MKAQRRVEVYAYSFFNLGAGWAGKGTRYTLYRRLDELQGRFGRVWKLQPPLGSDPRTFHPIPNRYQSGQQFISGKLQQMGIWRGRSAVRRSWCLVSSAVLYRLTRTLSVLAPLCRLHSVTKEFYWFTSPESWLGPTHFVLLTPL